MAATQGELLPNPQKAAVYTSEAITGRRQRILKETRKIIAESGLQGFSVRVLCKRSNVALRTLYNAFQSKDRLIAIAIREAYDDLQSRVSYQTEADTLEGIIDRLQFINRRNLRYRNYTKAVASLYFATNLSEDIWEALRHMVFRNLLQWLNHVASEGDLKPGLQLDEVASLFANVEYAIINDWAQDRIADHDFVRRLELAVLQTATGAMRGESHRQAQEMLDHIATTGKAIEFPSPELRGPEAALPVR